LKQEEYDGADSAFADINSQFGPTTFAKEEDNANGGSPVCVREISSALTVTDSHSDFDFGGDLVLRFA